MTRSVARPVALTATQGLPYRCLRSRDDLATTPSRTTCLRESAS